MTINRRTFIRRAALAATSTAAAALQPLSSTAQSQAPPDAKPMPQNPTDANFILFKIDGWDSCDTTMDNQMSIRINQAWRAAWR